MWDSTRKMALKIYEAFEESGYRAVLCNLKNWHMSDAMTEIIDAEVVAVGSPTLNRKMLPTVSAFLTYLTGLAPKNRNAIAFGSYGWGGESVKDIEEILTKAGFQILSSVKQQFVPTAENLEEIKNKLKGVIK